MRSLFLALINAVFKSFKGFILKLSSISSVNCVIDVYFFLFSWKYLLCNYKSNAIFFTCINHE